MMGSEGDHAALNCPHAPFRLVPRHEHLNWILERRVEGINCTYDGLFRIPHSDKRPGDMFACLEAPIRCEPCAA
jgi:hypothetical protein